MEEKKFCKFCGEQINKSSIVCSKCGCQLEVVKDTPEEPAPQNQSPTPTEPDKPKFYVQEWFMWLMLIICAPIGIILMFKFNKRMSTKLKVIIAIIFGFLFLLFAFIPSDDSSTENEQETPNTNNNVDNNADNGTSLNKKSYSYNETFEFDDLEITIGSNYTFTTINNKYSDHYQKTIVKLPITVKNVGNETDSLNMFYYNIFGSSGTETTNVWTWFDDSIESAGELRTGASYTKYLYFTYDGNGTYAIEFDNIWTEKLVEIYITK